MNRLLVAERWGCFNPGLRLARKASRRSPGATAGRQLRGSLPSMQIDLTTGIGIDTSREATKCARHVASRGVGDG